uniref:Uncharacterized protein n=1 Tax=Heterorhabditis bacteriophora TaxID=37862 RepID=A0A1I7W788_HETBA
MAMLTPVSAKGRSNVTIMEKINEKIWKIYHVYYRNLIVNTCQTASLKNVIFFILCGQLSEENIQFSNCLKKGWLGSICYTMMMESSDTMTFFERMKSFVGHFLTTFMWKRMMADKETALFRELVDPNFPDLIDIAKNCSLVRIKMHNCFIFLPILHSSINLITVTLFIFLCCIFSFRHFHFNPIFNNNMMTCITFILKEKTLKHEIALRPCIVFLVLFKVDFDEKANISDSRNYYREYKWTTKGVNHLVLWLLFYSPFVLDEL